MNIPSKTKRDTLVVALLVLILSWSIVYIFLDYQFKNSLHEQFNRLSQSTEKLFNLKVEKQKREYEIKLDNILKVDGLAEAVAENNYKQIDAIVSIYYKRLVLFDRNVKILTFRSPKGITLYRAHKPEFYGDKLNKKRKLIVDTNTLQKSFSGFEVGKLEMTYRVTKPIFYNDKYVGNVEVGIDPVTFIEDLNKILKTEVGIAIDKSLLSVMLNRSFLDIDDKYVLINGSEELKNYFTKNSDAKSDLFKVEMNIKLQNHLFETLGYLVVGFDTSEIVQKDKEFMYSLFFTMAIMMLLLGIVLHQGFNQMLKYFTKQAYTDILTKMKNRQALNQKLYSGKSNVLILSDIKEFSLLNELYGIDVGNEVLIQVGKAFEKFASKHSMSAYRISSDEYVLLKQGMDFEADKYNELLDELHHTINSLAIHIDKLDETLNIEIYSGIAHNYSHSLENAQMALKQARKKSLAYLAYSKNVDTKKYSEHVIGIKKIIRYALEHKNVIPFFQPITDKNGRVIKYEALVRIVDFENGEKNIIFPDDFLPIAIKSGLYVDITKEMLMHSLSFFVHREEKISINFLPNDFLNQSIMDTFMTLISKFDSPQKIIVEITEQESIEDFERFVKIVKKLRKIGVLIAIDDFGSGYANYAHILRIKPDYLKIDGSLIKNILTDKESKVLVNSIIHFARDLNIKTVAEYVENEEIFEMLKKYGVDEFQGYYFGRPTDLINEHKI